MAADVGEGLNPALAVTGDQDRFVEHFARHVAVRFRQLADMADRQPVAHEHLLDLEVVELRVVVEPGRQVGRLRKGLPNVLDLLLGNETMQGHRTFLFLSGCLRTRHGDLLV
ncbi:hypothetical protein D3C84_1015230 [compost metagenome]